MNFVNAQEMKAKHPDTFEAPTTEELDAVQPGSYIKVCADHKERFWCRVTECVRNADGLTFTATVANDLVVVEGLPFGAEVTVPAVCVYGIMSPE